MSDALLEHLLVPIANEDGRTETCGELAADIGATAIGFTRQESGRLRRLFSGNTSYRLVGESRQPAVVFSRHREGVGGCT